MSNRNRIAGLLALLVLFVPHRCLAERASQVLFIAPDGDEDAAWELTNTLCDFYGLTCARIAPEQAMSQPDQPVLDASSMLGVVVEASCLSPRTSPWAARVLWDRSRACHVPVLVLCTEPSAVPLPRLEDPDVGADVKLIRLPRTLLSWQMTRTNPHVTRELTAISDRVRGPNGLATLVVDSGCLRDTLVPLMLVRATGGTLHPIYMELKGAGGPVFLAAFQSSRHGRSWVGPEGDISLLNVIPILTFLRFAGGSCCWYRQCDQANLTIDDPWLTEPYGYLSYRDLLAEMEKVGFHTTIAFIPWNYDRSEENVVAIFRDHPVRYSLCVHGNNHDHWEFYRYRTTPGDRWPAKPLEVQEANIRQGLARMTEFRRLTGVPFDGVMVFPHCTPPLQTYTLLKKYNFMMTVNSECEPLDLGPPETPHFRLRPLTLEYGNFASLVRCLPAAGSRAAIALNLFVDNPVVFYEHHTLFRRGIDAFNDTAALVNGIQPRTEWTSLGEIALHLYLQRMRPDGRYDIKAFCRSIELTNDGRCESIYFVEKEETADVPIRQVLLDGAAHPYVLSEGNLRLTAIVGPGQSARIDIQYENDFDVSQVDIAKNDARVNRLRALSDYRDVTLPRHRVARSFIHFYYASMLCRLGPWGAAVVCCVFAAILGVGGWKLLRWASRPRSGAETRELSTEQE